MMTDTSKPHVSGSDVLYTAVDTPSGPRFEKKQGARHEDTCLNRERVEQIRERVYGNIVVSLLKSGGKSWPVQHLWFPRDTVNCYELRDGNPPSDSDRPTHMRGLNLVVHVQEHVVDHFRGMYAQFTNTGSESDLNLPFAQKYVLPELADAVKK